MQRKDLALRVLSTAAIMSIVTSIAAPAFADIYYIGNGSIDVETITSTDGKQYVKVTQGGTTYEDESNEIVIKDGTGEADTTLTEAKRAEGTQAKPAVAPAAGAATQELEATGSADAAGEGQPDPDTAFTLSEEEEDSAQTQEGKDNTKEEDTPDPSTEPPKKDVVYQYDPAADPEQEQQATKPALGVSAAPAAKTNEATQADPPTASPAADPAPTAPTTPAEGSAKNPTNNVIRVINDWAEKVLNIRLSNVNIKQGSNSRYADGTREERIAKVSGMTVKGSGNTKLELDGKNVLDSTDASGAAGLYKDNGDGWLTITDETNDKGKEITSAKADDSGSLTARAKMNEEGAAIGGIRGRSTKNIIIEGYATVNASGSNTGAGIGGGGSTIPGDSGDAENIIIRGHSNVTATAWEGAAIGGGDGDSDGIATGIRIYGHATVNASTNGSGAAIGAGNRTKATKVTIGTAGATVEQEDVHVTATSKYGAAIGNGKSETNVTIQGHTTIQTASSDNDAVIGSNSGNVEVTIKDNVAIDTDDATVNANPTRAGSSIGGGDIDSRSGRKVVVNIDGGEHGKIELGAKSALSGFYNAISGTEVNIGNNVLLKIKQSWQNGKYIAVNNAEAAVGKRNNPDAGGLVNTIGDNTELWYTDYNGVLQKIVHSKNLCKKELVSETAATCTTPGSKTYKCTFESFESNNSAVNPEHTEQWTETIPALGHHWVDKGDGTHTCTNCGATEALPSDTNSALELRVVDAEGMDQPFTVSQNGTLRTYTGAYDTATLTGDLDTLRYLQDHGAQTIRFVTNGQTSSFSINDLLAQGSGSEVFYLTHRGAEEPTLLLVEADHSELVKD